MTQRLVELMKMYLRLSPAEVRERLLRAACGENECGERLWYVGRIWNNQEDR